MERTQAQILSNNKKLFTAVKQFMIAVLSAGVLLFAMSCEDLNGNAQDDYEETTDKSTDAGNWDGTVDREFSANTDAAAILAAIRALEVNNDDSGYESAVPDSDKDTVVPDITNAISITLSNGNSTTNGTASNNIDINNTDNTITITGSSAETYALSGTLSDGQVIIDVSKSVNLILNGVSITSEKGSPLSLFNSKKKTITLAEGTQNYLTDAAVYTSFYKAADEEPNAALFSKKALSINGTGTLTVNGKNNNGIDFDEKMRAAEESLKTAAEREKAERANKNIEDRILDKIDREDIDRIFRTPEIKIIEDNNIKDPSTGKKALGAFILNENGAEIRLSSKADAQTYIHEKIHALARTLSEKDLERWDNLNTGIDLKTAQGQEDFVDLMLEHLRSKEKTGVQFFDDIIEMIKEFIEELRRTLKDANVLTPEVKEYLDSLLSNPEIEADDFLTAPEWNNYFKGEGGLFAGAESADNGSVNEINTILSRAEFLSFINTTMSNRTAPYKRVKIGNLTNDAKTRIETISGVRIGDIDIDNQGIIHALKKAAHNLEPDDLLYAENVINTSTDINISSKKHKSNTVIIFNKNINGEITILTELHEKHKYLKVFDAWRQKKARRGTTAKEPSANALNESPRADTSLSTSPAEKSSGDNLGDLNTTLYELEQDELVLYAGGSVMAGHSKDDFIKTMLWKDSEEFGLDDGTFDTSLKIAGVTEAEKIAELEKAWQTASETVAKIDKELLPAETDGVENDLELIPPNDWKDEGNTDSDPDEMYAGNTDWNIDEYEAQLASAYDKAAAPPPPVDGAITTTQADERFLDLMENEGERDKFIDLMQFTQQESEEYTDFETQIKNRELADKVKRTYGALHIGAEHGVTNLTNSQRKGIHTFIKNHPTQMRLLYTELADNAEFSGYAENEIHDKPHIIDVIRNRDDLSFKEQKTLALLMESADIQKKVDNGEIKTVIEAANEQEKELNNELKNITETAETLKKGYYSQPQF